MFAYTLLAVPVAYLLGAVPSAYIIGYFFAGVDMRAEGDGRISAAAVYRRAGTIPFLLTIIMDVGKGALAVYLATLLSSSVFIIYGAGVAVMLGHTWSVFLRFRGGLGATVMYGILAFLAFWQFIIAGILGGLFMLITRKSSLSTVVIIVFFAAIVIVQSIVQDTISIIVGFYSFILLLLMFIKRLQITVITRKQGVT